MMNKLLNLLLIITLMFTLCGCEKKSYIKEINKEDLNLKIENKESFYLYIYGASCSGCKAFNPIINEVNSKYKISVYKIDVELFDKDESFSVLTPGFAVLIDGNIDIIITEYKDEEIFKSVDNFKSFIDEHKIKN